MGFLANSAEQAFTKARRRAYVPEWFKPASYVVGGIIAVVIIASGLFGGSTPPGTNVPASAAASAAAGGGEQIATGPITVGEQTQPNPTQTAASAAPTGETFTVPVRGGGSTQVSKAGLVAAQRAAKAMFTGVFNGVRIADGFAAPNVLQTWRNPAVGNTTGVMTFPDGSFSADFPVDPDGKGSAETVRIVTVTVVPAADGSWLFVPQF